MEMMDSRRSDQRSSGRRSPSGVACSAGEVMDLSAAGMRLRTRRPWPEGESRTVMLEEAVGGRLEITAVSVWCRKEGWRRYVVGLRLEAADDAQRDALASMIERHTMPTRHRRPAA